MISQGTVGSNPTLSAIMEWYSSGLRGRFAKSLGWVTGAEVRILSTPPLINETLIYSESFLLLKKFDLTVLTLSVNL